MSAASAPAAPPDVAPVAAGRQLGSEELECLRQAVAAGGITLVVASGSMRPLLRVGDRVLVRACPPRALRLGDLVAVAAPAGVLVHRFLGWRRGGSLLLTRGDRCWDVDEPQDRDRLLGRVEGVERGGARLDLGRGGWRVVQGLAGAGAQAATVVGYGLRVLRAAALALPPPARPGSRTAGGGTPGGRAR